MAVAEPKNTAYEIYQRPDGHLQHMPTGRGYNHCVVPGHTLGGVLLGMKPNDPKHMKVIIDPQLPGAKEVDIADLQGADLSYAKQIAETSATGTSGIDLYRNQAAAALELIGEAQQRVRQAAAPLPPKQLPQAAVSAPTSLVKYRLPAVGLLPVTYDVAKIEGSNLILGVRDSLAESTYFPSPEMTGPIDLEIDGRRLTGYTTPIRYSAAGTTCCVLIIEEPKV